MKNSVRKAMLRRRLPEIVLENERMKRRVAASDALPVFGVIVLMMLCYVCGWLVGNGGLR